MHPDILAGRRQEAKNNLQEIAIRAAEKTGDEALVEQARHINDRVPEAATVQAQEVIQTERIINVLKAALDEYDASEVPPDNYVDYLSRDRQDIVHDTSGAEVSTDSEASTKTVEDVSGVGPELAENLKEAGYETSEDLKAASDEQLLAVDGLGNAKLKQIRADL